jgi:ribonuclease-3 family protein
MRVPVLKLAFLGDAVMELMVREYLLEFGDQPFALMHEGKTQRVCASSQAVAVTRIMPILSEEEMAVYKRGRNAKPNNIPRNVTGGEYAKATGLETLLGYLYMSGRTERLKELFLAMQEPVTTKEADGEIQVTDR